LAFPPTVRAEGRKVPTIGILWHAGSVEQEGAYYRAMLQGFADAGYIVGQTIKLEHRFPNEIPDNFNGAFLR
jgi:putative ABC transport system substrate-binding protein